MRSSSASSGGSWVRAPGRVSVDMILPFDVVVATVLRRAQPLPDDFVEVPVGGEERSAGDATSPVEIGHPPAGLLDEDDGRRGIPAVEPDLDHRLGCSLGQERVAPEVAEATLAPDVLEEPVEA